ncbi:MAG: DNA circularization N-terminal domain-containing protein [Pseudobacteriovorax sp.]|nr:DNA circularization N-terminal domain-containing protein [Pseudobacteriovorax sp.]
MSWRERYLEASFRGVKFFVTASPAEFGRHKIVHEFPSAVDPYIEDMGKKARIYPIEGFVIGDDYNFTRDLLIKASEEIGPGELIHPFLGIKSAHCLSLKLSESFDEGSLASFSFEFVEAGTAIFGAPIVDEILALIDTARDFLLDQILSFQQTFSVLKAPGYIVESASGLIDEIGDAIISQNGLGVIGSTINGLSDSIQDFKNEAKQLTESPKELTELIVSAFERLADSFSSGPDGVKAVIRASRTNLKVSKPSPFQTSNRNRESENLKALQFIVETSAVFAATNRLSKILSSRQNKPTVISTSDATSLRDEIITSIDRLLERTEYADGYNSRLQLKASLLKTIPDSIELANSESIIIETPTTPFNLSTKLYGSPDRFAELIERNQIQNPTILKPGTKLEFITHG